MTDATTPISGPTTPTPSQIGSLIALADRTFRPDGSESMGDLYPLLFRRDRPRQMRVFTAGGEVVSHVGVTVDDVLLLGARIRVAGIGAVCTDPDWRGKGLAGRLFDDAVKCARRAGAALMLISGNRSLYTRGGAHPGGQMLRYRADASSLPRRPAELSCTQVTADNCETALRLFEGEPIRWVRPPEDYAAQIACGNNCNRPGRTWLVQRGGDPVAVLSHQIEPRHDDRPKSINVTEYAGSREAMLSVLKDVASDTDAVEATIEGYPTDLALRHACASLGIAANLEPLYHGWATVKVLDFDRLWRGFAPLLNERLGPPLLHRLCVRAEADSNSLLSLESLQFTFDDDACCLRGSESIVAALFGSADEAPLAAAPGQLGRALRRALPLPLPNYGLNYV